jgi:hypothetical protein
MDPQHWYLGKNCVARYDEILKVQQMDAEVNAVTGEYAWARVHAARENSIRIQVPAIYFSKRDSLSCDE